MPPVDVSQEKFEFSPHNSCFNSLLGMNFSSTGINIDHARGLAAGFSKLYESLSDPDYDNYVKESKLDPKLALKLGDLGLLVYAEVKAANVPNGNRAIVVQGLTSSFCGFAKILVEAGKTACTDLLSSSYVKSFQQQQSAAHVAGIPKHVQQEIVTLKASITTVPVHVMSQFQLYQGVLKAQGVPEAALMWNEGWLTKRALEKLSRIDLELSARKERSTADINLLSATKRLLAVSKAIAPQVKSVSAMPSGPAKYKALAELTALATQKRSEWQKANGQVVKGTRQVINQQQLSVAQI